MEFRYFHSTARWIVANIPNRHSFHVRIIEIYAQGKLALFCHQFLYELFRLAHRIRPELLIILENEQHRISRVAILLAFKNHSTFHFTKL